MSTHTPTVVGLQVAESSSLPGEGFLLGWASTRDQEPAQLALDTWGMADEDTLNRWPDLDPDAGDEGWCFYAGDGLLADDLAAELDSIDTDGEVLAVWDAPVLFERLRPYGLVPPARLLDLKVMHHLRFPRWVGQRNLVGMGRALHLTTVDLGHDRPRGVMAESERAHAVGQHLMSRLDAEGWGFPALWHLQDQRAADVDAERRRVRAGRRGLRTGWPVWDAPDD